MRRISVFAYHKEIGMEGMVTIVTEVTGVGKRSRWKSCIIPEQRVGKIAVTLKDRGYQFRPFYAGIGWVAEHE